MSTRRDRPPFLISPTPFAAFSGLTTRCQSKFLLPTRSLGNLADPVSGCKSPFDRLMVFINIQDFASVVNDFYLTQNKFVHSRQINCFHFVHYFLNFRRGFFCDIHKFFTHFFTLFGEIPYSRRIRHISAVKTACCPAKIPVSGSRKRLRITRSKIYRNLCNFYSYSE